MKPRLIIDNTPITDEQLREEIRHLLQYHSEPPPMQEASNLVALVALGLFIGTAALLINLFIMLPGDF